MTLEQMETILNRLGIEVVSIRGSEIQAHCPGHEAIVGKKDNNPSWWINYETGAHMCFSCGYKGSITSLAANINHLEYEDAKKWLDIKEDLSSKWQRAKRVKVEEQELVIITEAALKGFTTPPIEALRVRGLTPEAASKYEIHWDSFKNNWIIPIRNPISGCLVGWQEKGFTSRFFRNYPPGVPKSETLFGYKQVSKDEVIVVESPLDVVRLESIGIGNGVAVYGASISDAQLKLIRGSNKIIMAMDNDDAGKRSSMNMLMEAKSKRFEVWFFNYEGIDVKDIGAMSKDEVLQGLNNAKHSLHKDKILS